MPRYRRVFMLAVLLGLLSGCAVAPEEQVLQGVSNARDAFQAKPENPNEMVGQVDLFVPNDYVIEETADEFNRLITNGKNSFALVINPNEKATSTFFYDLQKVDSDQQWLVDETFQQNGRFGFTTVKEVAENQLELVVSAGGVSLTTTTNENELPKNMDWMMKTVRSIAKNE
ncbi:hypothetical protein ACQKDB_01170 [Planococcus kocurii]|uniref:DUF4367 domain-containing protein n=1 Tax=Planococcus kocurii TaxID=1374 RepID=A0ABM5WXS0_9BACL|nr:MULTISPECIES: hypothetical protein [Planococcus]ALS79121.1 hypothetical protein AUO94_10795 [Planococcus kocurii]KAA0957984.1 hypothetical protein FQ085_08010 [Planococcus sp. ANT_H30]